MVTESKIPNKIGVYNALIVWAILIVFLILQLLMGSKIIMQILPALSGLAFIISLLFFWRGRENAKRILNNKNSTFRSLIEGGLIGAIIFPLLVLAFTWKFFLDNLVWNDSEVFNQAIRVLLLTILFGFMTGTFGGFVVQRFNEKTIEKIKNNS